MPTQRHTRDNHPAAPIEASKNIVQRNVRNVSLTAQEEQAEETVQYIEIKIEINVLA